MSVDLGGSGAGSEGQHFVQSNPCMISNLRNKCDSDIFTDNKE